VFQQAQGELTPRRELPQEAIRQVSITSYGAAASYKLHRSVAIGGALAIHRFSLDSSFRRFETEGFFGPAMLTAEFARSTQAGKDTAVAPSVGVLAERGPARFGVMYRHGASFAFETISGDTAPRASRFRIPHTLAFGASYRFPSPVLVAVELTRVTYSRLKDDFVADQARGTNSIENFHLDNALEVHGGVQYVAVDWRFSPRLRAGLWFDPDHSVQFTPNPAFTTAVDRLFNERFAVALATGKNRVHYTGGIGLTLTPHVEVNAGADFASDSRLFSASIILR
jgi:hypothetical protein